MKKKVVFIFVIFIVCALMASLLFAAEKKGAKKVWEVVYVAKLVGIPWFNVTEDGIKEASKQYNVNGYLVGPPNPDPAQQARMVEDLIAKGVDAICVAPNDAESLEPVFKKAKEKGILILTHESPNQKTLDYDIEMVDN